MLTGLRLTNSWKKTDFTKRNNMEQVFIIIYARDGKIKAISLEDSIRLKESLIKYGWVHTQTIDVCRYLQYLHNNCDDGDLIKEIRGLKERINV